MRVSSNKLLQKHAQPTSHDAVTLLSAQNLSDSNFPEAAYYRAFNLILWVLYTGLQWKCLPVPPAVLILEINWYRPAIRAPGLGS